MSSSDDRPELSVEDLYQQSFSDLARLQSRLPEAAVVSLAREVIRRLALESRPVDPMSEEIETLAEALVGPAPKVAADLVSRYLKSGIDVDTIYLSYLGQAAKRLGEWWETDHLTFAQVTIGIGRIYGIMRSLHQRIPRPDFPSQKAAVFASIPEEQHTLGVKMAADLAREEGWEVELLLDLDHDALVEAIRTSGQLVVGLSGAGEHSVPHLARLVLALRISVPNALILVSGNIVDVAAESVRLIHVDGMARSFDEAMDELRRLTTQMQADKNA